MRFDYSKKDKFEYYIYISNLGYPQWNSTNYGDDEPIYFVNKKSEKIETRIFHIDITNAEINENYLEQQIAKIRL